MPPALAESRYRKLYHCHKRDLLAGNRGVFSRPVKITAILVLVATLWSLTPSHADTIADHQVAQSRPIQLGTSGGNLNDDSAQFCCSGTLGALVQDKNGKLYVLSNNHVLARTNRGRKREPITQPGLVDANCFLTSNDSVAALTKRVGLHFGGHSQNVIDAAIAEIIPGQVDPSGNILGIGALNASIVEPTVGMAVKKSGRTSGVTQGTIAAVDVALLVSYDKICGVGSKTALFAHQIRITPGGFGDFSDGGDSGSLVVEDVATCPRAVGLLFAGGTGETFANPIADVLSKFKVNMVGCSATTSTAAVVNSAATTSASSANLRRVSAESLSACRSAKGATEADVLKIPGVVGVGIGISDSEPAHATVEVYSDAEPSDIRTKLPAALQSLPVKIIRTGTIHAL